MKKLMLFAVCSSLILSSCFDSGKKESNEDKPVLCVIENDGDDVSHCEDGQLLVFLPRSWGNDQLPIDVAALYCDFDHSIVYNNGGVVCKLDKKRWKKFVERAKKNQQNQQK
jgi:alpha-tubulin suppressor-like RCC1 family protein